MRNVSAMTRFGLLCGVAILATPVLTISHACAQAKPVAPLGRRLPLTEVAQSLTPPAPTQTVLPNGRNNWSQAYTVQGMVYLLQVTGDEKWARAVVDWGDASLAERDAPHPKDSRPYAWSDRSSNVRQPYVWSGFTGHV